MISIRAVVGHMLSIFAFIPIFSVAETTELIAIADNTLIEDVAGSAQVRSNARGNIFVGTTQHDGLRRGVLRFDVSSIPPGSTVTSVEVRLQLIRSKSEISPAVRLHKLAASWGEGNSFSDGGIGDLATIGDATWLHRFCGAPSPAEVLLGRPCGAATSQFWTLPGGDFSSTISATQTVSYSVGVYSWSSPQLAADVQSWINSPPLNFGWILIDEPTASAKAYAGREYPDATQRPKLVVNWTNNSASVPLPLWASIALGVGLLGVAKRHHKHK